MRSSDRQTPSSAVGKYCSVRRSRVILGQPEGPLGGLKSLSHGLDRQTLRDWVLRYNEHGLEGLADQPRDGRPPKLEPREKAQLIEIVLAGSDPETSGISAYTRDDLVAICEERFGKRLASTSIGRILKSLGLSRQKSRPSHPKKDPAAQAAFKKSPGTAEKTSVYA